jgi:hypothetical protein
VHHLKCVQSRINKRDVEGAATANDPSFGKRMRVTHGTVGEAITTIQRVGVLVT